MPSTPSIPVKKEVPATDEKPKEVPPLSKEGGEAKTDGVATPVAPAEPTPLDGEKKAVDNFTAAV